MSGDRWHHTVAEPIAAYVALGLTSDEARSQVAAERRRAVKRAMAAGATKAQIARALGLSVARIQQLAAGPGKLSPLERWTSEGALSWEMRFWFEPERRHEQRERAEYRRLCAKYGAPTATLSDDRKDGQDGRLGYCGMIKSLADQDNSPSRDSSRSPGGVY